MFKDYYNVVGVMSGTSLDGVDLAHVALSLRDNNWEFNILEAETISYPEYMCKRLETAVLLSPSDLSNLNLDYTLLLSNYIGKFLKKYHLNNVDAICSHGHTVLHQPHHKLTLQIGNLEEIKVHIKPPVVCNFRVQDVHLGGQGAPLVPIGDRLLFSNYNYCLNLGGFSNISFETAGGRIAFDICPVNTVLNYYAQQVGRPFDDGGSLASSGVVYQDMLKVLNNNPFYTKSYPKSLGIEFVVTQVIPLINSFQLPIETILCTYTTHIVEQIAHALPTKSGKMLVTGGGAYNLFLIDGLQKALPELEIILPENKIIEFKEALVFALLGTLRLRNENNILASVTGAPIDHCAGTIYY